MKAAEMVLWTNTHQKVVEVHVGRSRHLKRTAAGWGDPIGASYSQWRDMNNGDRVQLMLETALDLCLQGYDLGQIVREMAKVDEFKDLGRRSFPMCRALTSALVGRCLEPNTMTFDELLVAYAPRPELVAPDHIQLEPRPSRFFDDSEFTSVEPATD
jgi:hypothetical protein